MSQARETHLPAYEPPILPLTGTTTDALTRPVRNVESAARFITDSLTLLSAAAAELGEISTESSGSRAYNTDTDERKAERAELLEKIEAAVRAACDAAAKLEFQEAVVEEIQKREHPQSRAADAKRRQRMVRIQRGEEDDEEDEDEDDGTGEKSCKVEESVWHRYKTGYQKEVDEYVGLTDKEKYGHKTEYLQYRQRLFEAQYPDKPVPLDDHWFREAGAGAGDDSDDEIEIANEIREYKCPLSMQPFVNPVTSRKCRNHSFSKASIDDVFRTTARNRERREKGPVQITCPMPGCGNKLTQADFYDDPDLLRKAERAKEREERRRREAALREAREEEEAEERGEDEDRDGDGDVEMPDADVDESTQRRIKKERSSQAPPQKKSRKLQRRTNRPVDLDSDDDMDED